jgi:phage shock protein PspC (stress-responsive transcriptional regulator)
MNEIKRCSLGVGFTFEADAYKRLSEYLDKLGAIYKDNADSGEILADIEARIAELILSAQSSTESVVALPLVENIIAQLGSPEDISGVEGDVKVESEDDERIPRRLYRDLENSKLGGVCAGLARYFGVEAVWIRLGMFAPLILCFLSSVPGMWWSAPLGGNLFGILLLTYLILWFAIPAAKSARQKLEMEGKRVSAQNIAERQGATQEEKAKSSVASFVTTLGRAAVIVLKIMLGLLLFPVVALILVMLFSLVVITIGVGELFMVDFGDFGNLSQVASEVGTPLLVFSMLLVLVPALYIAYLFIVLLVNKRPKLWVLLLTFLLWIMVLVGTIFSGVRYAGRSAGAVLNLDLEELIEGDNNSLSRQIMEGLDAAPDAEQQAEIERLKYDPTAQSID